MSKLIVPTLLVIWLVGSAWFYTTTSAPTPKLNVEKTALHIQDMQLSKLATFSGSQQAFHFQPNQYKMSVLGDFNESLVELAYVLKNSHETFLCITGRYASVEKNFSNYANLGLARAEDIKKNLVFWGAPIDKIEIAAVESITPTTNNELIEGINYQVDDPTMTTFSPLNLYFKANKYKIKVTSPIKDYLDSLKNYLDDNTDKKVYITGHSYEGDNKAWNDRVSRYRATEAKKMMVKYGIDEAYIEVNFKGKAELLFTEDDTKVKNRRVEVRVK